MEIIHSIDNAVVDFFISLHSSFLTGFFGFFTKINDKGVIWISLTIILLIFKKTRKAGVLLAASLFVTTLLGEVVIKHLVCRERPFIQDDSIKLLITAPSGYSFPSNHTSSSFASATTIFLQNKRWGLCAFAVAILIATSRLYFTVHFMSDVFAGIILGVAVAVIVYATSKPIERKLLERKALKTNLPSSEQ